MASHTWQSQAGIASYVSTKNTGFASGSVDIAWFGVRGPVEDAKNRYLDSSFYATLFFDTSSFPSADTLKYKTNVKLRMHAVAIGYKNTDKNGYASYIDPSVSRYVRCIMGYSLTPIGSLVNMSYDQLLNAGIYTIGGTDKTASNPDEYLNFYYDNYVDFARHKCTLFRFLMSSNNGTYYGGCLENMQDSRLILTYDDVIPNAKMISPIDGEKFNKSQAVIFKWNYSESKTVGQKSFSIRYTNGGITKTVTRVTANHYYEFPESTFSEGEITYYLTVTNNDNQTSESGPYTATVIPSYPSVEATYPVDTDIQKSQPFTITWNFSETANTGQKSYTIKITQNGKTETVSGEGTATAYTFPAYKYTDGQVQYYITVTNNDGKTATAGPYKFNIIPSYPTVSGLYPIGVLVKKSKEFTIAWNYSEIVPVGQVRYWLYITQLDSTIEYAEVSANHYHTIQADTLSNGECSYTIKVLNKDGQYGICGPYTFIVVGDSEAPEIQNVTNDARPTISWTLDTQEAFEIVIYDNNNNKIYESGLVVDKDARAYQIDSMLKNGEYIVEIRALNIYGYYTPWGTHYFTLSAKCVSTIQWVYVFATKEYGVSVDCETSGGQAYIIRRKTDTDEVEVIGKYEEGFVDYTVPANESYQYAIRLYDVGIVDSAWKVTKVTANEVIIRDLRDPLNYVQLWQSENNVFNIYKEESRNKSLVNCIGRTFPVREQGEWITSTRTFTAYVTLKQYDSLVDMEVNGAVVGYQARGEYMKCDMSVTDNGMHFDDGRNVTIILTRVDE